MKIEPISYNDIKRQLIISNEAYFSLNDLIKNGLSYKQAYNIFTLLIDDHDFFLLNSEDHWHSWLFVYLRRILNSFIDINLGPSEIYTDLIPAAQMHNFIRMKIGKELKDIDIKKIINELSDFGLIASANNAYSFPIQHLIKHIRRSKYEVEYSLISDYIINNYKTEKKNLANFLNFAHECIISILKTLKPNEEKVLILRYGLEDREQLTLEEIGNQIGVTRERIRQIEVKTFHKLRHPTRLRKIKFLYYQLLIANRGCVLIARSVSPIHYNSIILLFHVLGVPFYDINEGLIIGAEFLPRTCFDEEMLWHKDIKPSMVREKLNHLDCWWLGDKDEEWLLENLQKIINKKQNKAHRIYITMKNLGIPSHFSDITLKHNEIFPEYYNTERNIHAALCCYPSHFIWTGKHGIYALPEWGFEKPKMSLFETCYEIIRKRYIETGKPVEYSFVQSQIHKYRKLVNPNSIIFSCYYNSAIDITEDKKLIPAEKKEAIFIDTGEDYEIIEEKLKEFEENFFDLDDN